jgi:hypothetical protein
MVGRSEFDFLSAVGEKPWQVSKLTFEIELVLAVRK